MLFASRKGGNLRLCIEYRAFSQMTVKNGYPFPRVDNTFDQLTGDRGFSKIDLRSGYHQIRPDDESVPSTAFRTRDGHFEFLVPSFGPTNAPVTFKTLMNEVFSYCLDSFVTVYLEGVLTYNETMDDHVRHLQVVLGCLGKHELYGNVLECVFAGTRAEYSGHIIGISEIPVDLEKARAINDWPKSEN